MSRFYELFSLSISHNYYQAGCADFQLSVTREAAKILKKGRLLAKETASGLLVAFEGDDKEGPIVSVAGETIRIGLKLANPFFDNFTDLDSGAGRHPFFYYHNFADPMVLARVPAILVGNTFAHRPARSERPVKITLQDGKGRVVQTDHLLQVGGHVSYDLSGFGPGAYTATESYSSAAESMTYCCDPDLLQHGVFAVIDIRINAAFYQKPVLFNLQFKAKEQTLKYYLVAKKYSQADLGLLEVKDNGGTGNTITFLKSVAPNDLIAQSLQEKDATVVLFESDKKVRRSEQGRQKIQLVKNGDVLIKHLPQPGADRPNAEVIIHISKR